VKNFDVETQAEMIALSYAPQHGAIISISNVSFANGGSGISVDYADGANIRITDQNGKARVTTSALRNPFVPSDHPNYIIP
jgi:hypothetical protein